MIVEDRLPGAAGIIGPKDATIDLRHVENVRLRRHAGDGAGSPAAEWADVSPMEKTRKIGTCENEVVRQNEKQEQKEKPEFPFDFVVAYVHTELGERDAATAALQRMSPSWDVVAWQVGNCFPNLVTLRIEPMWDPLRSDPKFQDLAASMHFPD